MDEDWETPYEEGEEFFYDDDGTFGVGLPPTAGTLETGSHDRMF